ncbi:MAG: FAD-binding protein [Deltaproteobacteria bacterium]|nr:FAD-binding protein [Deltaproteobacteria bacterium]
MADHQPLRGDQAGVIRAGRRVGWDEHTDVVVVGLGAGGGAAAVEACRQGADVMLVDRFAGGGATGKSAGAIYFGGGTNLQRAAGYDDTPENMFAYLQLETADAVPEATLRSFCETSVEHFEWLRAMGCPFPVSGEVVKASLPPDDCTLYFSGNELCPPFSDAARPAPRGHRPLGPGLTGHLTAASLRHAALEAGVQLRTYTRAERLVVDGAGEVIGVMLSELPRQWSLVCETIATLVQYGGGMSPLANRGLKKLLATLERRAVTRLVRAKRGVVLALGGFVFDPELMERNAPDYAGCSLRLGTAGDDGTGIRMGQAVGGAVGQMDRCTAPRFIDPPTEWWGGILVGRSGERICNETYYGGKVGEHLIERHQGRGTLVLDSTTMMAGRRQVFAGDKHLYQRIFGVINGWISPRSAPTLAGLADKMGIDPQTLARTVAEYNDGVARGRDALGKAAKYLASIETGPFYGIPLDYDSRLFPTPCLTLGGLRTEGPTSRVLTDDGTPIDGLYAAGRTAVGVASNGYASGLSISDGLFAGRNAGRHAAART